MLIVNSVQAHIDTDTHRHIDIHTHRHTHTHTDVHMGNLRKLLLQTQF